MVGYSSAEAFKAATVAPLLARIVVVYPAGKAELTVKTTLN
jgi:hypothetical protein